MEIQKVRQQMPSTGQIYKKMPLYGDLALYRNDRHMHRGGALVRLELTRPRRWKPPRIFIGFCVASSLSV